MEKKGSDRWTDQAVQALLEYYANEQVQRGFKSSRRNEKIFQEMSAHLDKLGFQHTTKQCREKIKKLKQDYKRLKDHNNKSDSHRKSNKWYNQLDSILGHCPAFTADPGTKDSVPSTSQAVVADHVKSSPQNSAPEDQLSMIPVSFQHDAVLSCSSPHPRVSVFTKKRKRDDIEVWREMEEEGRRQAREERERLFMMLAEHEQRATAARVRQEELHRQEAEAARQQMQSFHTSILGIFWVMLSKSMHDPWSAADISLD